MNGSDKAQLVRVNKFQPCPICGENRWCSVASDGKFAICMRAESDHPCKSKDGSPNGYLHRLDETVVSHMKKKFKVLGRGRNPKRHSTIHLEMLLSRYRLACPDMGWLSKELGVSEDSLRRLEIGWDGKVWTFPMRNGEDKVIGFRKRKTEGGYWSLEGGNNGLFWPLGVSANDDSTLAIVEGPTDTAAILDLGLDVIGRPSCNSCVSMVIDFLKHKKRPVVIVSDFDKAKVLKNDSISRPGQEGAEGLGDAIRPYVERYCIIYPTVGKDSRQWVAEHGCTRETFDHVTRGATWI